MKSKIVLGSVLSLFMGTSLLLSSEAEAKKIKVKLGTLAPKGSPWHNSLAAVASRWKKASKGKVKLKIYPGGVAGDEGDVLRKVRVGQLHAATITNIGLGRISRASIALQVPMMYSSYEELDYVREKMGPKIEAELEKAGFVVLDWGDAGWVHFFSKGSATTPDDFRKLKLFVWSGDPEAEAAWKAAKFNAVPTSSTDVLSGLQTGRLEAFSTAPLFALTSQWFGLAKHMLAINWAPLNGATIVSKKTWDKIPPELQKELKQIVKEETAKSRDEIRRLGAKAIKAMADRGLTIHTPDAKNLAAWKATAEMAYPAVRGKVVPIEYFDEAQRLVNEYRKQKK